MVTMSVSKNKGCCIVSVVTYNGPHLCIMSTPAGTAAFDRGLQNFLINPMLHSLAAKTHGTVASFLLW